MLVRHIRTTPCGQSPAGTCIYRQGRINSSFPFGGGTGVWGGEHEKLNHTWLVVLLPMFFQVVPTPRQCPEQPWHSDQRCSRGKDLLPAGPRAEPTAPSRTLQPGQPPQAGAKSPESPYSRPFPHCRPLTPEGKFEQANMNGSFVPLLPCQPLSRGDIPGHP